MTLTLANLKPTPVGVADVHDPELVEHVFHAFPKIPRLSGGMIVTEKLDGTNAAVIVTAAGNVYAQSRRRVITPQDDNYGFAAWVESNAEELARGLGQGVHFGEWWGHGIQRGYGLDRKVFSLFNTARWHCNGNAGLMLGDRADWSCLECPACEVVPVIMTQAVSTGLVKACFDELKLRGSYAAPGFMNPEGVVVYLTQSRTLFKYNDAKEQS